LPPGSPLAFSVMMEKVEGEPGLLPYTSSSGQRGSTYVFGSLRVASPSRA
jgi:hypothetical protein